MIVELLFIWLILWGIAAFAVYTHTQENHPDEDPVYWAMMVLILGIIGIVIYAIAIADGGNGATTAAKRVCPKCNLENGRDARYCNDCGSQLKPDDEIDSAHETDDFSSGHPNLSKTAFIAAEKSHNDDDDETETKQICPECHLQNDPDTDYCDDCGTQLKSDDEIDSSDETGDFSRGHPNLSKTAFIVSEKSDNDDGDIGGNAETETKRICPGCNSENVREAKYCNNCGSQVRPTT